MSVCVSLLASVYGLDGRLGQSVKSGAVNTAQQTIE